MKKLMVLAFVTLTAIAGSASADLVQGAGYCQQPLYSSAGSGQKVTGLEVDNGTVYFAQGTSLLSMPTWTSTTSPVGAASLVTALPANIDVPVILRVSGTLYAALGTSYAKPFPYQMGYIGTGGFAKQVDLNGINDVAVNSRNEMYIVANPGGEDSRIYRYDAMTGTATEVGNMGGYSGALAFDANDNLYYAHQTSGAVVKFTNAQLSDGGLTEADGLAVASYLWAGYITFDDAGHLLVSDYGSIKMYDTATGNYLRTMATDSGYGLGKIQWDNGMLYTIDTNWMTNTSQVYAVTVLEPATMAMLAMGGAAMLRRRKR